MIVENLKIQIAQQLHHTDRLTLPIFGGSSKLFITAKSFLGWLAAGDVWLYIPYLHKNNRQKDAEQR